MTRRSILLKKTFSLILLTNVKTAEKEIVNHDYDYDNEAFKKAIDAIPNKPGYTEQLREKLGGNNAF